MKYVFNLTSLLIISNNVIPRHELLFLALQLFYNHCFISNTFGDTTFALALNGVVILKMKLKTKNLTICTKYKCINSY